MQFFRNLPYAAQDLMHLMQGRLNARGKDLCTAHPRLCAWHRIRLKQHVTHKQTHLTEEKDLKKHNAVIPAAWSGTETQPAYSRSSFIQIQRTINPTSKWIMANPARQNVCSVVSDVAVRPMGPTLLFDKLTSTQKCLETHTHAHLRL